MFGIKPAISSLVDTVLASKEIPKRKIVKYV